MGRKARQEGVRKEKKKNEGGRYDLVGGGTNIKSGATVGERNRCLLYRHSKRTMQHTSLGFGATTLSRETPWRPKNKEKKRNLIEARRGKRKRKW